MRIVSLQSLTVNLMKRVRDTLSEPSSQPAHRQSQSAFIHSLQVDKCARLKMGELKGPFAQGGES